MVRKIALDKVGSGVIAIATPSLIMTYLRKLSGFKGAAGFNSSLKTIGGGDMYRGALAFLLMTIATDKFIEKASEQLALAFVKIQIKEGVGTSELVETIENMPISEGLRAKLILEVYDREEEISE